MKTKNHVCVRKQSFSFLAMGAAALVCFTAVFALSCGATGLDGVSGGKDAVGIKSFRLVEIPDAVCEIDNDLEKITITVPNSAGQIARNATPEITFAGAYIEPPSGEKRDFGTTLSYDVYGDDGNIKHYIVITRFTDNLAEIKNFVATDGTLSYTGSAAPLANMGTIELSVPKNTVLTSMVATVKVSAGFTLETGKTVTPVANQPDTYTVAADDFTKPVSYTVTDGGQNTRTYALMVVNPPAGEKRITSFVLTKTMAGPAVITHTDGTITASLSNSLLNNVVESQREAKKEDILKSLVPSIIFQGVKIEPKNGIAQDFTKPVTYTVTADDNTTKDYVVIVDFPVYGEDIAGYNEKLSLSSLSVLSLGHVDNSDPTFKLNVLFNPEVQDYTLASKDKATAADQLEIVAVPFSSDATLSYGYESSINKIDANVPFTTPKFLNRATTYTVSIIVQNTVGGQLRQKTYTLELYRGQNDVLLNGLGVSRFSGNDDWMIYPAYSNTVGNYSVLSKNYDYAKRLRFEPVLPDGANSKLSVSRNATSSGNSTGAFTKYDGVFTSYSSATMITIPASQTRPLAAMAEKRDDMRLKTLPPGDEITFRVTAEDRETTRDYRIANYAWVNPEHPAGQIPKAGGGKIEYKGGYEIHTFEDRVHVWTTYEDYLNIPFLDRLADNHKGWYLLLGGGGAGGSNHHNGTIANGSGGGGGGGQLVENTDFEFTENEYKIIVGAGGKQENYVVSLNNDDKNKKKDGEDGGITKAFGRDAKGGTGGIRAANHRDGEDYNKPGKIKDGVPQGGNGQEGQKGNGGGSGAGTGGNDDSTGKGNTGGDRGEVVNARGGVGLVRTITGSNEEYGRGGNTIYEGTTNDWGGGNGGNAERYAYEDYKDTKNGAPRKQKDLGVNSYEKKYGEVNREDVHIQGGNGVVIVRLKYETEFQQ